MTMRVLWLMKHFGAGGAERVLLEMAPHVDEVSFQAVATHMGGGQLYRAYDQAGLSPLVLADSPLDPRWIVRLRRLIRDSQPDLVHAHLPVPGVGSRIASLGLDVPIAYTEHSLWQNYRRVTRLANAWTYSLNDTVIAVSDAVRRSILRSRLGSRAHDRIHVVPNGIDVDGVARDGRTAVPGLPPGSFGCIISLVRWQKGLDVLVRALPRVVAEFPDRRCVVVGEGDVLVQTRALAERLGVASSIDFLGRRQDARAVMARLEVVVLPSRVEGLPLTLLEAMSLGRPIVATRVGGIPEVVQDGENGLLVPPDDPVSLAEAVARLLREPDLAGRLGSAARATVSTDWSISETATRYVDLYRRMAGRPASAPTARVEP